MKKDNWKSLAIYSQLTDDIQSFGVPDPEPSWIESNLKLMLDEIFSVDPVSGFPKGDIQYYLSSEGNPQIKQWLENNLLRPRMSGSQTLEGVTDDIKAEFARKQGESVDDYRSRLMSLYDSAKAEYERLQSENVTSE